MEVLILVYGYNVKDMPWSDLGSVSTVGVARGDMAYGFI
jgi:hypothetical protein